jgi:hypothetical protein
MQLFAEAFEDWTDSGMKFRKFHVTSHYSDFIRRYGAPALSYAGWWEKAIRFLVKVPYLRTGRRLKNMFKQLMHRIAFAEVINRKRAALERECPGETLSWELEELESGKKVWRLQRTKRGGRDARMDDDSAPVRASSWDNTGYLSSGEE